VVPGDQLRIEVSVLAWRGDFCKLEGKAFVDGQLAAEATLMCKMVDRDMVAAKEPAKQPEKVSNK
jgi:3-hydroxyacyl-[acyl-carrier-protein] dehydratase